MKIDFSLAAKELYTNPIEESIFGIAALKQIRDEAIGK
jgi:hypothetical protein